MNPRRRMIDQEPAGAGRRLLAFAADLLIAYLAVVVLLQLVLDPLWQAIDPGWLRVGWFFAVYTFFTVSLPILLYFAGYESSGKQATIGMQWLGLRVTDEDGQKIGLPRAILRNLIKLLPFEVARLAVALPANPFVHPLTGELTMPSGPELHPWLVIGLLLAIVLLGLYLLMLLLDGDGRAPHDRLSRTYVLRRDGSPDHGRPASVAPAQGDPAAP